MKLVTNLLALGATLCFCSLSTPSQARDVDGPNDCTKDHRDFGDAPEVLDAYPGVPGKFPSCVNLLAPAGTIQSAPGCAPRGSVPGATGWVEHVDFGQPSFQNFWFGCYFNAIGPFGIDAQNGENEAKVNSPPAGFAFCATSVLTDCVEVAPWGASYDQDECAGDGSDAGLRSGATFVACQLNGVSTDVYYCGTASRNAFFNVLLDMNSDGDWNDNFRCPAGCAYEWMVKNQAVTLNPGCNVVGAGSLLVGPNRGPGWLRITITSDAVTDDFPWAGSNDAIHGGEFIGGETEDYPAMIDQEVPTWQKTLGGLKAHYR